jgi:HK97 family phage major capsid protein
MGDREIARAFDREEKREAIRQRGRDEVAREAGRLSRRSRFRHYLANGGPIESRDLSVGTASAGGYLVPRGFYDRAVIAMKEASSVLALSRVWESGTGAPADVPIFAADTSNVASVDPENAALTFATDPVLSTASFGITPTYSVPGIRYSRQLAQDATIVDLERTLAVLVGRRAGRALQNDFTNGTGTNQPLGFAAQVTNVTTAPTGSTTKADFSTLLTVKHSVNPAYWPTSVWMASTAAIKQMAAMADTSNRPLLAVGALGDDGTQLGRMSFLGHPVYVNDSLPVPAANAVSIFFGSFRYGYIVRHAGMGDKPLGEAFDEIPGVVIRVLRERFADSAEYAMIAYARYDGRPGDLSALAAYKQSAT